MDAAKHNFTNDKIWSLGDWMTGLLSGSLSFAVYAWTVAPNVTLLDSGEFIVAAQHFGVPHPTGYPLWTFLAWVFQLLPLGNAAWEINLFSGVCGGLSVGLLAALTRSSLRWLMGSVAEKCHNLISLVAVSCSLLFAFSASMWSQATITEVYTLHSLLIGCYLTSLYVWLRRSQNLGLLILCFFQLALAFSNHHLSIVLAPLPFLAVLLLKREIFWDLVVAASLTLLLVYLGFAILSTDPLVLKTALRFFYCVAVGLIVLVIVKRFQMEWRLIAYLPFAVALGMLPYIYMPLASATNPPMNWAYTRTPEGFFYSFNRSQYSGSLSQQSLRTLGRAMGALPALEQPQIQEESHDLPEKSSFTLLQEWVGFFGIQLTRSFTPIGILGYFAALFIILRLHAIAKRTWVYLLEIGFILAAVLQPFADKAEIDVAGWWLQMPYHTYTNFIFALLASVGITLSLTILFQRLPRLAWIRFMLLTLPIAPLILNCDICSQRERWFGWKFGHDMLKDLPQGSILFGGTDPGRFVPTYMIFGESGQPSNFKRDPTFDRRDLYIITQNGVGEPLYRQYLRDHYSVNRPQAVNAFQRWLGREETYPKQTLVFPTEEEIHAAIEKEITKETEEDPSLAHSVVTRLIWEKNRGRHKFFVEESFPLKWSYDHALPHGLVYELTPQPVSEIPKEVVEKDRIFWKGYIQNLTTDPNFARDLDAQRSFSKLRSTSGNIYTYRKMRKEAEFAYRQALQLWSGNPDALNGLSELLWDRGDFDGVIELLSIATAADPNNFQLWRLRTMAEKRKQLEGEIHLLEATLAQQPRSREVTEKLLDLYSTVGETVRAAKLLDRALAQFREDPDFLRLAANYSDINGLLPQQLTAAKNLVLIEASNGENFLILARAAFRNNDKKTFYSAARRAIELSGLPMQEAIQQSPLFHSWKKDPEFKKLIKEIETLHQNTLK